MDLKRLGKIGLVIDVIVLLYIPMIIVAILEIWWLQLAPYKLTSVGAIIYAFPISLPAILYFLFVLYKLGGRFNPIVIGYWYNKELNKQWEEIKDLPINLPN